MRAFGTLLLKELRGLVPLAVLFLLVQSADLVHIPLTKRLDEVEWWRLEGLVFDSRQTELAIGMVAAGLIAAYSLFPREHDEGTIDFLYSLPVSRRQIFGAKVGAALAVLVAAIAWSQGSSWFLARWNHQSLSGDQFRPGLALALAGLQLALATGALAQGICLSFLRGFGLVVLGIEAWVVVGLTTHVPALAFLDPTRIVRFQFEERRLVWPWRELAVHGGLALVSLALGFVLWMGPGTRWAQGIARLAARVRGGVGRALWWLVAVALAVGFLLYVGWVEHRHEHEKTAPDEDGTAETRHYRFTFPAALKDRALPLVASADDVYDRVRAAAGASDGPPIAADLTKPRSQIVGITAWQTIRVSIAASDDGELLRAVLAHETVHALQLRESRGHLDDDGSAVAFFAEGMAEHVAGKVVPRAAAQEASRLVAVVSWQRGGIRFDELANVGELQRRRDPGLVYTLGETWCEALERACGPEAAGNVLRAMGREDAPRGLAGLAFWQDTLHAAGYDLERVNGVWQALLAAEARRLAPRIESIPRLKAEIVGRDGEAILVRAHLDRPALEGTTFAVRTREPGASSLEVDLTRGELDRADPLVVRFRVPSALFGGDRLELQLGQRREATLDAPGIFSDWEPAAIPR